MNSSDCQLAVGSILCFTCCAVTGSPQELWQLHHVSLDAKKKFRVVFQGAKEGSGPSTGGMSLDDINLSETTCPEFVLASE